MTALPEGTCTTSIAVVLPRATCAAIDWRFTPSLCRSVNTIAPTATTRMTEDIFPPELLDRFQPGQVAPAALFLVSEEAPTNVILGAGAGVVQAAHVTLTRGAVLAEPTPEAVAAQYAEIIDRTGEIVPQSGAEQALTIMQRLQER